MMPNSCAKRASPGGKRRVTEFKIILPRMAATGKEGADK